MSRAMPCISQSTDVWTPEHRLTASSVACADDAARCARGSAGLNSEPSKASSAGAGIDRYRHRNAGGSLARAVALYHAASPSI